MPKHVFKNAQVIINSVDLSDYCQEATLNLNVEPQDATAVGNGSRVRLAGLIDWSLEVLFLQDYDSGKVDDTIFPLMGGEAVVVEVTPKAGQSVSVGNPKYYGSAIPVTSTPFGGTVGTTAQSRVSFQSSGDLTKLTS